jgi:hypothetical protein
VIFRRRFGEIVARQLDIFEEENGELIAGCEAAEEAYDRAPREEAEEHYGDYMDLVESGTEVLAELRDNYARRLDDDVADEYQETFNRAVLKRFSRFALEIEDL